MIRPESAPVYDQVDLKLGIKSSLPSVKPTLALLFLMWREMGRPCDCAGKNNCTANRYRRDTVSETA